MGNGNGSIKVFGLSIREFIILISAVVAVIIFFVKTSAAVSSWETHLDDRLDEIEKHLEYDDQRLDVISNKMGIVVRRLNIKPKNEYSEN